jgi:hypothetical protein
MTIPLTPGAYENSAVRALDRSSDTAEGMLADKLAAVTYSNLAVASAIQEATEELRTIAGRTNRSDPPRT